MRKTRRAPKNGVDDDDAHEPYRDEVKNQIAKPPYIKTSTARRMNDRA